MANEEGLDAEWAAADMVDKDKVKLNSKGEARDKGKGKLKSKGTKIDALAKAREQQT